MAGFYHNKQHSSSLMQTLKEIQTTNISQGTVGLWWLGQSGFIIKSPGGIVLALDPYLSNSCKAIGDAHGFNFDRMVPSALAPAELAGLIDAYLLTHTHGDHLDPETLEGYRAAGGKGPYVAPMETVEKLQTLGVPAAEILPIWPNKSHTFSDLTVQATFAIPLGGDDLTHVGYLVKIADGPCLYLTGDTGYHDVIIDSVGPHQPDLMAAVINGAFRNMSPAEAARMAKELKVKAVIPCHHDLFPDNSLPTVLFHTNLKGFGIGDTLLAAKHGELILFSAN
jgi:L-ascorbate 6-phosphate lactonase